VAETCQAKFAEALVISFDETYVSEPQSNKHKCAEHMGILRMISGCYKKIGNVSGTPVYRQSPPLDPSQINCEQLFLSRHDGLPSQAHRGWYITRSLIKTDEVWQADGNIVAWDKNIPGEPHTFPRVFHVTVYF
jgi:hypothetical protein